MSLIEKPEYRNTARGKKTRDENEKKKEEKRKRRADLVPLPMVEATAGRGLFGENNCYG